jgi:hypothetical protein
LQQPPSNAHTYHLLIFKDPVPPNTTFVSPDKSFCLSSAEKRDYELLFAAGQHLNLRVQPVNLLISAAQKRDYAPLAHLGQEQLKVIC